MKPDIGIRLSYAEKLRDPRWQKMRLKIMERDEFQCRQCRSKDKTLNVHHCYYSKGKMPWEYPNEVLVTLCEDCHQRTEAVHRIVLTHLGVSRHAQLRVMHYLDACLSQGPWAEPEFPCLMDAVYGMLGSWEAMRSNYQCGEDTSTEFDDVKNCCLAIIEGAAGILKKARDTDNNPQDS